MNAACLTEEEMHVCVVKAGISDEQKENPEFYIFYASIFTCW